VHILDEDGNELPTGETGVVWFERGERSLQFEYYADPDKDRRRAQPSRMVDGR
jgi:fatty-acyl-CoA synthase